MTTRYRNRFGWFDPEAYDEAEAFWDALIGPSSANRWFRETDESDEAFLEHLLRSPIRQSRTRRVQKRATELVLRQDQRQFRTSQNTCS